MTTIEPTLPDMPATPSDGIPFTLLALVEGLETSDGRMMELGTTTWRETPIPFMVQDTTAHGPDQVPEPAWAAGQIDQIYRDPTDMSRIIARGSFMPNEVGQRAIDLAKHAFRGVSIDAYPSSPAPPGVQATVVDQDGNPAAVLVRYADTVISRVTMVPTPALEACCLWFDDEDMPAAAAAAHGQVISTDAEPEVMQITDPYEQLVASGGGPVNPPRAWFFTPEPPEYQPLRTTPEGHTTGHLARDGQCHIGYVGQCQTAPRSNTTPPFKAFHRTVAQCADGSEVTCGWLTMQTTHADRAASHDAAAYHYDHSGTLAAKVRATNGVHGTWLSGAVSPGLTDHEAWVIQAPSPSGDWRTYVDPETSARYPRELMAALVVPFPGFPETRPEVLVASGEIVAQIGVLDPCDCDESEDEAMDDAQWNALDERVRALEAKAGITLANADDVPAEPLSDADVDALVASMDDEHVELSAQERALWLAKYNADDLKKLKARGRTLPGTTSYPIGDEDDLGKAVRAIGRGGPDHDKIRRYVIRVAKEMGKASAIPSNWNPDGSLKS